MSLFVLEMINNRLNGLKKSDPQVWTTKKISCVILTTMFHWSPGKIVSLLALLGNKKHGHSWRTILPENVENFFEKYKQDFFHTYIFSGVRKGSFCHERHKQPFRPDWKCVRDKKNNLFFSFFFFWRWDFSLTNPRPFFPHRLRTTRSQVLTEQNSLFKVRITAQCYIIIS